MAVVQLLNLGEEKEVVAVVVVVVNKCIYATSTVPAGDFRDN